MAPTVPTKKATRASSLPRAASTQRDPYPKPASTKATKETPIDISFAGNQNPFETKQDTFASQDAEVNLPTPDVVEHTDASQPPAWLIEFQNQIRAHDARLTQIESRELEIVALREQLNETHSALTEAHSQIALLRAQLHANQLSDNHAAFTPEIDSTMENNADFPTLKQPSRDTRVAESQHAVDDFDASKIEPDLPAAYATRRVSFATVPKKVPSSSGKHQRRQPTRRQKQFVAVSFTPPSESQGFQYVYLPCRKKEPRRAMREKFHKLGITRTRILDVHFPNQNVVAILVLNDYVTHVTDILVRYKIPILSDFNPLNPTILRDPKLLVEMVTTEERVQKLTDLQQSRLIKCLQFVQHPTSAAIARDFVRQQWLTPEQAQPYIENTYTKPPPTASDSSDKDQAMQDIAVTFSTPATTSPADIAPIQDSSSFADDGESATSS